MQLFCKWRPLSNPTRDAKTAPGTVISATGINPVPFFPPPWIVLTVPGPISQLLNHHAPCPFLSPLNLPIHISLLCFNLTHITFNSPFNSLTLSTITLFPPLPRLGFPAYSQILILLRKKKSEHWTISANQTRLSLSPRPINRRGSSHNSTNLSRDLFLLIQQQPIALFIHHSWSRQGLRSHNLHVNIQKTSPTDYQHHLMH